MTTIRPTRRAAPEPDAAEPAAVGQHLPPASLRSAQLSVPSLIGLGFAAAAMAALAVFGLDLASAPPREPTTGSFAASSGSSAPASPPASSVASKPERPAPLQMAAAPSPQPAPPVVQFAPTMPQVESRVAPPPLVTLSGAEVAAHLAQGEDKLKAGEVAAARLYFERVALSGDARGALGMARTYDPAVLATLPVIGPQPDAAAARTWRDRARSLRAGP